MRVQVYKSKDGVQDILFRPSRASRKPMVLLQEVAPALIRMKVATTLKAIEDWVPPDPAD